MENDVSLITLGVVKSHQIFIHSTECIVYTIKQFFLLSLVAISIIFYSFGEDENSKNEDTHIVSTLNFSNNSTQRGIRYV